MATRTILGTKVQDGETFTYSATILDEDGTTPVDLTAATTDVLCTLYRTDTNVSLNSRLAQSVITAGVASNNHTGTAAGVLTFEGQIADSTLGASADVPVVIRYAIGYTGTGGARDGVHEVQFTVEPLVTVT